MEKPIFIQELILLYIKARWLDSGEPERPRLVIGLIEAEDWNLKYGHIQQLMSSSYSLIQEGWAIESVTTRHIRDLGEFAVDEYNRTHDPTLIFVRVFNAESLKLGEIGTYYRLTIVVKAGNGNESLSEDLVLESPRGTKILKSFVRLY